MQISYKKYCQIIDRYFKRLHPWETHKIREKYYDDYLDYFPSKLEIYTGLKFAIIKGFIEYGFPFTLEDVIFLPFNKITETTIRHEFWHIYFRYSNPETKIGYSDILVDFCKKKNIVKLERKFFKGEITNPDTDYTTGLIYKDKIIFCALFHPYKVKYFVCEGRKIRAANEYEKNIYNIILDYPQNYHPEEILANIL